MIILILIIFLLIPTLPIPTILDAFPDQHLSLNEPFSYYITPERYSSSSICCKSVNLTVGNSLPSWIDTIVRQGMFDIIGDSFFTDHTQATRILVKDGFAYVTDISIGEGLKIFDVSDPTNVTYVGGAFTSQAWEIQVNEDSTIGYLADGNAGLRVYNLTDKTDPTQIGTVSTSGARGIAVDLANNKAIIADDSGGVRAIDITDPTDPIVRDSLSLNYPQDVKLDGDYAYLASKANGVYVVDVSNILDITEFTQVDLPDSIEAVRISLKDKKMYIGWNQNGLRIFDYSDMGNIHEVGHYVTSQGYSSALDGNRIYFSDGSGGAKVLDISDPGNIREIETWPVPSGKLEGFHIDGNYIYSLYSSEGFRIRHFGDLTISGTTPENCGPTTVRIEVSNSFNESIGSVNDDFAIFVEGCNETVLNIVNDLWEYTELEIDCNGKGTLDQEGNCDCEDFYYGPSCDVTTCDGILSNQTNACANNGICVSPDICLCSRGYLSELYCHPHTCFGFSSEDSENVCSGRGICERNDSCVCEFGYHGFICGEAWWKLLRGGNMTGNAEVPIFGCNETSIPGSRTASGSMYTDCIDRLYLFGGISVNETNFGVMNDLWRLDTTSSKWCQIKGSTLINADEYYTEMITYDILNVPAARNSHSLFGLRTTLHSLFLFGGDLFPMDREVPSNDLWEYDLFTDRFRVLFANSDDPPIQQPGKRFGQCSASLNGGEYAYIFGGSAGNTNFYNDVWKYSIEQGNFDIISGRNRTYDNTQNDFGFQSVVKGEFDPSYFPNPRVFSNCWLYNGNFFVFGGYEVYNGTLGIGNSMWDFNMTLYQWGWISGFPEVGSNFTSTIVEEYEYNSGNEIHGRAGASHWLIGNELFVFGGEYLNRNPLFADLWSFSISQRKWKFVNGTEEMNVDVSPRFIGSRSFLSSGIDLNNKVLLFGGYLPNND